MKNKQTSLILFIGNLLLKSFYLEKYGVFLYINFRYPYHNLFNIDQNLNIFNFFSNYFENQNLHYVLAMII